MTPVSPAYPYPGSAHPIPCTAHHRHHGIPCAPRVCRAALLAMCATPVERDRGERDPMPDNSADMVLTPDEWRARQAQEVAA